jgi:hypothetical protein
MVDVVRAGIARVQKPGMARTFHILVSSIPAIPRDYGFDILSTTNANIA